MEPEGPRRAPWRDRLYDVIFEAETPAGRAFDVVLLVAILASIVIVSLESVEPLAREYGTLFRVIEWTLTLLFSLEYVLRLVCVRRPLRYALSFFGLVDLVAVLPTYVALVFGVSPSLMLVRAFRLLRIFRVLKLGRFVREAAVLRRAIWESRAKIIVFLATVFVVVVLMGAAMYLIEGPERGFTSIPQGMYWAVVTMTTVGYGDIAPQTTVGKLLSAMIMVLGYSLIIVPTSLLSAELARAPKSVSTRTCGSCLREGHDLDAKHCKHCGGQL